MTATQFTVTTGAAGAAQGRFACEALRSQRGRVLDLFRGFSDETWTAPTRCTEWSVHEVVRHLCDATVRWHALLRGDPPDIVGTEGMDPRTTPVQWLERSAAERPADTVGAFERASAELLEEVDQLTARGATDGALLPYGAVPWSVVVLHLLWDAWVHERDILVPQGRKHESPEIESRAAATFALIMSCLPFKLVGLPLEETVVLDGDGGGAFRLDVRDDTVTVTVSVGGHDVAGDSLRGELTDVVDSLIGRGPDLTEVLHGPVDRVHRLGKMRRFMLAPAV